MVAQQALEATMADERAAIRAEMDGKAARHRQDLEYR